MEELCQADILENTSQILRWYIIFRKKSTRQQDSDEDHTDGVNANPNCASQMAFYREVWEPAFLQHHVVRIPFVPRFIFLENLFPFLLFV